MVLLCTMPTAVLIIVMTFPNGLWVEDNILIALALVTEVQMALSRMKMSLLLPSALPVVLRGRWHEHRC